MKYLFSGKTLMLIGGLFISLSAIAEDGQPIPGDLQSYGNYVERVAACAEQHRGNMKAIRECALPSSSITIIQSGDQRTVIQDGQTTISVEASEPFIPSEMTRRLMGEDYDWARFSSEKAQEISICLDNGQCNANAFKTAYALGISPENSISLSTNCVAPKKCNLDAFSLAYEAGLSPENSLEVSLCVPNECDLEAFLAAYEIGFSPEESLVVARCAKAGTCNLQAFLQVYRQANVSIERSLEVATCSLSHACDWRTYVHYYNGGLSHDDAINLAHQLHQPQEGTDGEGSTLATE